MTLFQTKPTANIRKPLKSKYHSEDITTFLTNKVMNILNNFDVNDIIVRKCK